MIETPVNEGQDKVVAYQMDLQKFADEAVVDTGGGVSDTDTGANTADADVGTTDVDTVDSGVVDQNGEEDAPETVKGQSPEANKAFAEMRKRAEAAERKAEIARDETARQIQLQKDARYAEQFGKSHGIYTEAQYWQAMEKQRKDNEEQARQQALRKPKEVYQQLIKEGYDPKVAELAAKDMEKDIEIAQLKQDRAAEKLALQQKEQAAVKENLAKKILHEHDYLTKKYGDLVPSLDQLDAETIAMMRDGVPLKAAWLAVNEDKVIEHAKRNGTAKALKNVNSKSHLTTEKDGGGDFGTEVTLSPEQLRVWKAMGYSDKEARKRASKYVKQGK